MNKTRIYGFEMSRISEVYLSTLSSIMTPQGLERYFFPVLYLCEATEGVTQTALADVIRRDKVYTMRVVDYLCERKFLVRKKNLNDRRCQVVEVTDKARALVPKIKQAIQQTNELLFHDFSQEEKEQFEKSMAKIYATIENLPEPEYIVKAHKINKK